MGGRNGASGPTLPPPPGPPWPGREMPPARQKAGLFRDVQKQHPGEFHQTGKQTNPPKMQVRGRGGGQSGDLRPLSSWAFFPVRWLGRYRANEASGALLGRGAPICPSITITEIIDAPGRGRSLISPKGRPALSLPRPPPEPRAGGPRPLHLSPSP